MPRPAPTTQDEIRDRILELTDRTGDCWLWMGGLSSEGYAKCGFRIDGTQPYGHRLAFEAFVGPIREGLHIDHLCRVRSCVNPEHLEPVTAEENNRRSHNRFWQAHVDDRCVRGHDLADPENVYVRPNGRRMCRPCRAMREGWSGKRRKVGRAA